MSVVEDYAAAIKKAFARTTYGQWVESEGVATYEGFGVGQDVRTLELAPWPAGLSPQRPISRRTPYVRPLASSSFVATLTILNCSACSAGSARKESLPK